jgi:hypothetical protein
MSLRLWNGMILAAMAAMWMASGTQREKPVLADASDAVRALESTVARAPADSVELRKLAQAYLDAGAPGLALAAIERAPVSVRVDPRVEHVYARALLEQGRSDDALYAERRVLATCTRLGGPDGTGAAGSSRGVCDTWLTASATRRAEILQQLVELGIEDAQADPEASAVAYHNATREARLAIR